MPVMKDYTGNKIGALTARERTTNRTLHGYIWIFDCDCGGTHLALPSRLQELVNKARPPRCSKCNPRVGGLPEGQAARNKVLARYKLGAETRNLIWELNEDEFYELTQGPCYYCGELPSRIQDSPSGHFRYNGIDRIDNVKGYTINNTVSCCSWCNRAKNNISKDEFLGRVFNIYERLK